jgi:hypothetical protein
MITEKVHPITSKPRTLVECDAPDCPENYWLPVEVGPFTGASLMTTVGWQVIINAPLPAAGLNRAAAEALGRVRGYPAYCPDHAEAASWVCHHDRREAMGGGSYRCCKCGAELPAGDPPRGPMLAKRGDTTT